MIIKNPFNNYKESMKSKFRIAGARRTIDTKNIKIQINNPKNNKNYITKV